jgi:hypothetical protein
LRWTSDDSNPHIAHSRVVLIVLSLLGVHWQLAEFLGAGKLSEKYVTMLPPPDMLVEMGMDREIAFHVSRPLLRAAVKQKEDDGKPTVTIEGTSLDMAR